jgi:3-oxoacyl-[acyl-carrier-protein] synthase-3
LKIFYIIFLRKFYPTKIWYLVKAFPEWNVEKIAAKIEVNNKRHISAGYKTSADMAFHAVEKLFAETRIDRTMIDFLLLCTQSPDYFLPASSCIIAACSAIDCNQDCLDYIYGLSIAKSLIAGGMAKNVLLIISETYTKYLHPKDKSNRAI